MTENLRILKLLLQKSYLVRRRQWKAGLFGEILIPVGLMVAVWVLRNTTPSDPPINHTSNSYFPIITENDLFNITSFQDWSIFFTPNNSFTNALMEEVGKCFQQSPKKPELLGFNTERELIVEAQRFELRNTSRGIAVIFDDENSYDSTKNLVYTIRSKDLLYRMPLYNAFPKFRQLFGYYTIFNAVIQLQICVDRAFIDMKSLGQRVESQFQIAVQRLPYPPYLEQSQADESIRQFFGSLAVVVFMIPLFIETSKASSEKFLGVSVLMSMNGVSNALNLLSWLLSGWLFLSLFCVIPIIIVLLISTGAVISFWYFANPFIIGLVFVAHIGHLLMYGIHVSAYFPQSLMVTFGLLIIHVGSMDLQLYAFDDDTYYLVPYFGLLFPNLLLFRACEELNYYEAIQEGSQWSNMFVVGNLPYRFPGSLGMTIILSIVGIFLHFILAVYIYAINPGKYGVGKHPLYFLNFREKIDNETQDLAQTQQHGEYFEPTSGESHLPGIQILNLKKSYNIGLFKKSKVHALKGVSIEFYRGQITALLGHNGAGKTTLMSILTGMTSPSSGQVLINSKNIKEHAREIMNDLGLCTQENMLFPDLSVGEQLRFFAKLKGKDKTSKEIDDNLESFLEKLKLAEKRHAIPRELSGGQKRRLCLGMALVGDPKTLILDEPTSGLDPENRRIIWDILLKLRGHKTILISTHDMEEADILGDRIAILHAGLFRSCGTSMFLKRLIGQGNVEVTLSVEPWCDTKTVLNELSRQGKMISQDGGKVVFGIPNSPTLPDSLDKLENTKKTYGVTGLSVSLISLEQVFLRVTQDPEDPEKSREPFRRVQRNTSKLELFQQSFKALLMKKIIYTAKNTLTIFLTLLLIFISWICITLILRATDFTRPTELLVPTRLNIYHQPETYYKSFNGTYATKYEMITKSFKGLSRKAETTSLNDALLDYASDNIFFYDNHMIAAAEFNKTDTKIVANAFYSEKACYSFPISMNMLSNTILKSLLGDEYSIMLSVQKLPSLNAIVYLDFSSVQAFTTAIIFVFLFFPTTALFVLHPIRESTANVKQLQRMTGVSSFMYWGTIFFFDLLVYLLMALLIVFGFIYMDYILNLKMYGSKEIWMSLLSFALFAFNILPFTYIFSFKSAAPTSAVRLLTYVSVGLVSVEVIMFAVKYLLDTYEFVIYLRKIQKGIFLLIPYVSFFHSQVSFYNTTMTNARCKRLPNEFYDFKCQSKFSVNETCCSLGCRGGRCTNYINFFDKTNDDISLEQSLAYLLLTPLLYFGVLVLLEKQWIQRIISKRKHIDANEPAVVQEEQVKNQKLLVAQKISALSGNDLHGVSYSFPNGIAGDNFNAVQEHSSDSTGTDKQVFLVYELQKHYGKLLAVKDVSFAVDKRECFGLLGVNGAGKSTTFRMMTGGEIPDNGSLYVKNKDLKRHRKDYLSQMGYCPQNDALIKSLNSYDHLRLFARLRGIPEDKVESEVRTWIQRLNLTACASQPSGTYSGGNKRRLNIAMTLIGIPDLVLLDEPTTGVDPGARRSLWNVIQSCQITGQAVVLTSHSMEECEALCNRIAIMVSGRLVCIGPVQELKQRFGTGYDIQIKMNAEKAADQVDDIRNDMSTSLPCELADENTGFLMYHVKPTGMSWRKMYDVMNELKERYNSIEDFTVSSSTLEQLFLIFAKAVQNNST
ncbi:hypothetical protein QAD02_022123 [Eretmocerus hayati]|uniref:Uncharacterized protein n=1 Tax=Eretmocerus hayati TaxID=131215 RepID=A0ACC2PUL5_9HYME|nr:hypothetical protein QAD02_022123 [Eretmocerus hayati]